MTYIHNKDKPIDKKTIEKALNRLGELLQSNGQFYRLTCCGGIVSVMYFRSRLMTQDVDAIFPEDEEDKEILTRLIKQVGAEMGLHADERSLWFNDSVSFFGLETTSNTTIFSHPGLELVAASWEEMLAHKVHASRHDKDIEDAALLLKEINNKDKDTVFGAVKRYAPAAPLVPEPLLRARFEKVWKMAFGP